MFVYYQSGISRNVTCYLLLPLLIYEASEPADVDVIPI